NPGKAIGFNADIEAWDPVNNTVDMEYRTFDAKATPHALTVADGSDAQFELKTGDKVSVEYIYTPAVTGGQEWMTYLGEAAGATAKTLTAANAVTVTDADAGKWKLLVEKNFYPNVRKAVVTINRAPYKKTINGKEVLFSAGVAKYIITQAAGEAFTPIMSISSTAPGVTIPKGGATYYTNITSNTDWKAEATNATVTASGSGDVTTFAIKANSSPVGTAARTVSVVFTTIPNPGQTTATATWRGTQKASDPPPPLHPAGCSPTPIPGFSNVYVALADNDIIPWQTATNNCAAWGGRLPSKDELLAIYQNQGSYSTFVRSFYWSSTPKNAAAYHIVDFENGDVNSDAPDYIWHVRCVKVG
ncbi:MAG: hypothetical protein RSA26_00635, partial [Mucinivorans sp.]